MEKDLETIARLAALKEQENCDFRQFVKFRLGIGSSRLRQIVRDATEFYQEQIKCEDCGNCCRILQPRLSRNDIRRLSKRLDMKAGAFVETYLEQDEEGLRIRELPCPFFDGGVCSVYEDRPAECRGYPYLNKDIAPRMWGVIDRSAQCPIVFNVLEDVKAAVRFRRRR